MGSWCAENLRNVQAFNEQNLAITTVSDEAAKLFDAGLRQVVSWIDCQQLGGIEKTLNDLCEADPKSIIGRCLINGVDALSSTRSVHTDNIFVSQLEDMVKDSKHYGNPREQKHAQAVHQFALGNMTKATELWEDILKDHPTDLMAVKFAHDAYFFKGDAKGKLRSINNVIDKWNPTIPCYGYLFGMQAFGYEENEDYVKGKESASKGLLYNKQDAWSTHAMAHCHEMLGEYNQGITFMESTVNDWEPCWMIACHNFWHNALFYIEKGDYESALTLYDNQIAKRANSKQMLDIVDGASFLQRLHCDRVDVGKERWSNLFGLVKDQIDSHMLAFNDAHLSMVLSNIDDEEWGQKQKNSFTTFIGNQNGNLSDQAKVIEGLGQTICEAITNFNREEFEKCFDLLYPIRNDIYKIGGSNAQRDVFTQILIHAGLRSPNKSHNENVKQVISERRALKPDSPLLDRITANLV